MKKQSTTLRKKVDILQPPKIPRKWSQMVGDAEIVSWNIVGKCNKVMIKTELQLILGRKVLHIFNKFGGNSILFSFIFKDDKPVLTAPTIQTIEDKEVISNPQEPMRIEEKVRY